MVNRPKQQGTARETWWVRKLQDAGLWAQRAPNNAGSWDVTCLEDVEWRHEVKDRQTLNVHTVLDDARAANPDHPVAVVWHRYARKAKGQSRRQSLGTVVVMDPDQWIELVRRATDRGDA